MGSFSSRTGPPEFTGAGTNVPTSCSCCTLPSPGALNADHIRVLAAMALFTFGSLAIWPFMERAAHAIGISPILFGRFQSVATLASTNGFTLPQFRPS